MGTECAEFVLMDTNDLTEDFFIENEEDLDKTDDKENNVDLIKVNIDQHQIDSDLKLTQMQNPKVREQVIALKRHITRSQLYKSPKSKWYPLRMLHGHS